MRCIDNDGKGGIEYTIDDERQQGRNINVEFNGNINLLAKDKVDDSIMRVLSKEIASELMEITFGDNG